MAEWYLCRAELELLLDVPAVRRVCVEAAESSGLTVVGERFVALAAGGVGGMVLLAESHLSIRTWPANAAVALDVFVCNHLEDNGHKVERVYSRLRSAYVPGRERMLQLRRCGVGEISLVEAHRATAAMAET